MLNLRTILRHTQSTLKAALHRELRTLGYSVIDRPGFLYAEGSIPVLLVAHLDTVHRNPPTTICTSQDGTVLMSPEGIGGDDRAGVYIITQLLQSYHCHVLFCEDEEIGGKGATAFEDSGISPAINYIIEFDRRGENDAVFYDCDNPKFTEFVCSHGFRENVGTFSDISIVAPALNVAAVNLSSGYFDEHTPHEHLNTAIMQRTIDRVCGMLDEHTEVFDYIPAAYTAWDEYERWPMSPLPVGAFIKSPSGELRESADELYVDPYGSVFRIVCNTYAIEMQGYEAFTAQGVHARYDDNLAQLMEVIY